MAAEDKVTVKGQSGAQCEFEVYPECADFKALQGFAWIKLNQSEHLQRNRGGAYVV
jgi:hypothetical protein